MDDDEKVAEFKAGLRKTIIETLVLRNALIEPVLAGRLSVAQSEAALLDWLDSQSKIVDRAYGRHFREPAMMALYTDSALEEIDDLKRVVKNLAEEIAQIVGRYGKT